MTAARNGSAFDDPCHRRMLNIDHTEPSTDPSRGLALFASFSTEWLGLMGSMRHGPGWESGCGLDGGRSKHGTSLQYFGSGKTS